MTDSTPTLEETHTSMKLYIKIRCSSASIISTSMVLGNGIHIVWLIAYIGQCEQYHAFKRDFQTTLQPAAAVPPDSINALIFTLEQNAAPLSFAHTPAQAATLIEQHHDKRIIFISSGSLGRPMLPFITAVYPHVYRFYIFCTDIDHYADFDLNYGSSLQVFNNETDLLVLLACDISSDIIKLGEAYLAIKDGENALKCFEHALALNNNVNQIDKPNPAFSTYLKRLNGDGNDIGLIQRAKNMLNQQK